MKQSFKITLNSDDGWDTEELREFLRESLPSTSILGVRKIKPKKRKPPTTLPVCRTCGVEWFPGHECVL